MGIVEGNGGVSSQFVNNKNAALFEQNHPRTKRAVERQHYVDDYLDYCVTEEEAILRIKTLCTLMRFEIVKWMSNSPTDSQNLEGF